MFGFNPNQIFNIALAMVLAAVATAASLELRSQPIEVSKLVSDAAGALAADKSAVSENETPVQKIALAREVVEEVSPKSEAKIDETNASAAETKIPAPIVVADAGVRTPDASAPPIEVSPLSATKQSATPSDAAIQVATAANEAPSAPEAKKPEPAAAAPSPASAPAKETKVAALAAKPGGVIFEDLGRKVCIGGTQCEERCKAETGGCEVKANYTIKLDQPTYISAVQFFAHDDVGPTRRSELFVRVNGEPIGKIEAHRYGSTRTVKIGRTGQLITIESRHRHNGLLMGGEEAVLWDVYLLGRDGR
jgi:hypothetical protein